MHVVLFSFIYREMSHENAILFCFIVLSVLTAIIIFIYQHKLLKQNRAIQKNRQALNSCISRLQKNEIIIIRNKKYTEGLISQIETANTLQIQLKELKQELSLMQKANEVLEEKNVDLQKDIAYYFSILQEKHLESRQYQSLTNENLQLHEREKYLTEQLIRAIEPLNQLRVSPKYMNDGQWINLEYHINQIFNNYTHRLQQRIPSLTTGEMQFCCLIKLHLSNSNIATILGISPASVSKRKLRLKDHILSNVGAFDEYTTLDLWLWDF